MAIRRSRWWILTSGVLVIAGCTHAESSVTLKPPSDVTTAAETTDITTTSSPSRQTTRTSTTTSTAPDTTTTTSTTTTTPSTSTTATPTTTSTVPTLTSVPPSVVPGTPTSNPGGGLAPSPDSPQLTPTSCVYTVVAGDSLTDLEARYNDDSITLDGIMAENHLTSPVLSPGQLLDVCVGDSIDSVAALASAPPSLEGDAALVAAQQTKLNELFAGLGIAPLEVDGDSGAVTRQRLCAWRLTAGLPVSRADMEFGSDEERLLMAMPKLTVPVSPATQPSRWVLIDQHCQIMFVGEGPDHLAFVFPTSTGLAKYPTRLQDRSEAFKYDPASRNRGWHDSYDYPASDDNPLNGNMYRPLYFDRGQAIHGANNVPRKPASHGCARLRVSDMDTLVTWLGLDGQTSITKDKAQINLVVSIQGKY